MWPFWCAQLGWVSVLAGFVRLYRIPFRLNLSLFFYFKWSHLLVLFNACFGVSSDIIKGNMFGDKSSGFACAVFV